MTKFLSLCVLVVVTSSQAFGLTGISMPKYSDLDVVVESLESSTGKNLTTQQLNLLGKLMAGPEQNRMVQKASFGGLIGHVYFCVSGSAGFLGTVATVICTDTDGEGIALVGGTVGFSGGYSGSVGVLIFTEGKMYDSYIMGTGTLAAGPFGGTYRQLFAPEEFDGSGRHAATGLFIAYSVGVMVDGSVGAVGLVKIEKKKQLKK